VSTFFIKVLITHCGTNGQKVVNGMMAGRVLEEYCLVNQLQSHGDRIIWTFFMKEVTTHCGIENGMVVDGCTKRVWEEK
jgi:hypothetical protein